jgi:UrcA family protein
VLLGLAMWVPASASAADRAPLSRRVSYADLDLNKREDVATLNRRLTAAAEKVCRPESESVALRLRRVGERCVAEAIAGALERLDATALPAKRLAERER